MRRDRMVRTDPHELTFDRSHQLMTVGRRTVSMAEGAGDNESILRAYLDLVAEQRGVRLGQSVLLRRRDVAVLAEFLDLDDAALEQQLADILRLPADDATALRRRFHNHRTAAAAGVDMVLAAPTPQELGEAAPARELRAKAPAFTNAPLEEEAPLSGEALARMDAVVEATPPVVVAPEEWERGRRRPSVESAPDLEMPHSVTIPGVHANRVTSGARRPADDDQRAFRRDLAFLQR